MIQSTKKKLIKYRDNAIDLIMVALCFYALGWLLIQGVTWYGNAIRWLFYGAA